MNKIRIFFSVTLIAGLLLSESVQAMTFTQVKNYATTHKKPLIVASALSAIIIGTVTYYLLSRSKQNKQTQNRQDNSKKNVSEIPNELVDEVVDNDNAYGVFSRNDNSSEINNDQDRPESQDESNDELPQNEKDISEILNELVDKVVDNKNNNSSQVDNNQINSNQMLQENALQNNFDDTEINQDRFDQKYYFDQLDNSKDEHTQQTSIIINNSSQNSQNPKVENSVVLNVNQDDQIPHNVVTQSPEKNNDPNQSFQQQDPNTDEKDPIKKIENSKLPQPIKKNITKTIKTLQNIENPFAKISQQFSDAYNKGYDKENRNSNNQLENRNVGNNENSDEDNDNSIYNPQLCYKEHDFPAGFFLPQVFNPSKKFIAVKDMHIELNFDGSLIEKVSVLHNGESITIEPGNYFCIDEESGTKVVYWYTIDKKRVLQFVPQSLSSLEEMKKKRNNSNNFLFAQICNTVENKLYAGYWIVRQGPQNKFSTIDINSEDSGSLSKFNSKWAKSWSYRKGTKTISIQVGEEFVLRNDSLIKLARATNDEVEILHIDGWQKIKTQVGDNDQLIYDNNSLKLAMLNDIIHS